MKKIILSKANILKAIFTSNISFHKLYKLLNYCTKQNNMAISKNSISILILNKALIDLIENNTSNESDANTFTIIGKIDYKKLKEQNKIKHPKGIDKKIPSKVIILNTENKEKPKEKIKPKEIKNVTQNKKVEIKPASIRVSEQKNLFSKTITITPIITPKKKAIINSSAKKKEENINQQLKSKENRLSEIKSEYEEIFDTLSEDDKTSQYVNDNGDGFINAQITANEARINAEIKSGTVFDEDSIELKVLKVAKLIKEEKRLNKEIKQETIDLHNKTKTTIESLTDDKAYMLLEKKWIEPLILSIEKLPNSIMQELCQKVQKLSEKYATTLLSIENNIKESETQLADLIDELTGSEFDIQGLKEFQNLLRGV